MSHKPMGKLFFASLFALFLFSFTFTFASAALPYDFYQNITIDSTVSPTLTNFPAGFNVNTANLILMGKMKADCSDIAITNASDSIIPFEIENGTCNTASTRIWLLVSNLPSTDTLTRFYYGNASATSLQNKNAVWSNGFFAVYHGGDFIDSTNYSNTLTPIGAISATNESCIYGKCFTFTASGDYAEKATAGGLPASNQPFTMSAWTPRNNNAGSAEYSIITAITDGTPSPTFYATMIHESSKRTILFNGAGNGIVNLACDNGDCGSSTNYNANVYNGTGAADDRQYLNTTADVSNTGRSHVGLTNIALGGSLSSLGLLDWGDSAASNRYIDEARFSNVVRTTAWLNAEFGQTFTASAETPTVPNNAPLLQTITFTATANNQTLIASANATNDNPITYFWRLFRNNTLILSGSNGTFTQGVLANFNNFSANSVSGTYIVEVTASDGSLNSSTTNSSSVTVTFPVNAAPTLQTVLLSVTSNNQTLIASANATDPEGDSITYLWRLFRNNTLFSSGSNGTFPQGILRNFNNYSINTNAGTYIVEVKANDGNLNSTAINSSPVTVTFPSPPVNSPPVMITLTQSLSADNHTLSIFANATDANNASIFYHGTLNNSGSSSSLGNTALLGQGVLRNIFNVTINSNGNYSSCAFASDGINQSANFCTSFVQATFAPVTPPSESADIDHAITIVIFVLVMIILLYFLAGYMPESQAQAFIKYGLYALGLILFITLVALLI